MKWISVKDKMPDQGRFILVTDGLAVGIGIRNYDEIGHGYCDYSCPVREDITHWMPLPIAPEYENE